MLLFSFEKRSVILLNVIELRIALCSMSSGNLLALIARTHSMRHHVFIIDRQTQVEMGQATRVSYRTCDEQSNHAID